MKHVTNQKALITGITGQDGAYLSRLLLENRYEVHGLVRRCSSDNTRNLREFLGSDFKRLTLHNGDMTDTTSLLRVIERVEPNEVYIVMLIQTLVLNSPELFGWLD